MVSCDGFEIQRHRAPVQFWSWTYPIEMETEGSLSVGQCVEY